MRYFLAVAVIAALMGGLRSASATEIPITILSTNDLHSRFQPSRDILGLGGIARIGTLISRIRKEHPNTLLFDAGDWSEGSIYFNLDAGRTSLELLDALHYDAAVIGNHDWINGPDHLLDILTTTKPHFPLLAVNLDFKDYSKRTGFGPYVRSHEIFTVQGVRIAVIGLETYEFMYDKFIFPVKITYPFGEIRRLAQQLKSRRQADLVVALSHNSLSVNKLIAGLPNVDLVVSGHGHNVLTKPIVVKRNGKTALVIEAGYFGRYLGHLDFTFDTETRQAVFGRYELIPIDRTIPEDPKIRAIINQYDKELRAISGDIFSDRAAESRIELRREGRESILGNLLADAYREYAKADVAFEQVNFVTDDIYVGPQSTVDIYSSLSQLFTAKAHRAWTLKTMTMSGETLDSVINLALNIMPFVAKNSLSVSGLAAVYDPTRILRDDISQAPRTRSIVSLVIGGKAVDFKKQYTIAMPQGIIEAIEFLEGYLGITIPYKTMVDTGMEDWRIFRNYLHDKSPIESRTIGRGDRLRVLQADLALYYDEIELRWRGQDLQAAVLVRNVGATDSNARALNVTYSETPQYGLDAPCPVSLNNNFTIPAIKAGDAVIVATKLAIPAKLAAVAVPIHFQILPSDQDGDSTNDDTWVMAPPALPRSRVPN